MFRELKGVLWRYPYKQFETFEFLLKFGKSSYRRIPDRSPGQAPVSSYFKMFWTPAFAGVTTKVDFQRSQFAFMAQRVLEKSAVALAGEALDQTGSTRMAVAGGVFSNIKKNIKLVNLHGRELLFVFPHMGDGGLALGVALAANRTRRNITMYRLNDLSLGPGYTTEEILAAAGTMPTGTFRISRLDNPAAEAARLILGGEIVLWFQGRMELGPRALGHRSILARPDDRATAICSWHEKGAGVRRRPEHEFQFTR